MQCEQPEFDETLCNSGAESDTQPIETYDLCVIGAGIAGLNALAVAVEYLPRTAKVILVDRNDQAGGMWNTTYDFVRLHQPYRMYTAGDLQWRLDCSANYLATGSEVRTHLADCLEQLSANLNLVTLFSHECESCTEIESPVGPRTRVQCRSNIGESRNFDALRCINAASWDIPRVRPLGLSSEQVQSVTPKELCLRNVEAAENVIVVGGGKTGMDTAQHLIRSNPDRNIILINGRGTVFGNRDKLFPTGWSRWWSGTMIGAISADLTQRFDGRNHDEVFEHFRRIYAISHDGQGEHYLFSLLSSAEARQINGGLTETIHDYLEDVVDTPDGPEIQFRSGRREPIQLGTVFVNCTGHLFRQQRSYAPYVSPLNTLVTLNTRSSVYSLPGTAAYMLAHLFFLGKIADLPLYELDFDGLIRRDKKLFFLTSLTHSFYNVMVVMENTPLSVFGSCGLDLNRWYPLPRRLAGFARMRINLRGWRDHCRAALDQVQRDTGLRCGLLSNEVRS